MSAPTLPDHHKIKRILNKLEAAWETMPERSFADALCWASKTSAIYATDSDELIESELDTYLKDHSLSGWKS